MIAVAVVMVLVAAAAVTWVVVRDDGESASGEIFLEAASSTGTDPFGALPGPALTVASSTTSTAAPATTGATTAVRTVSGGERGLYGGTLDGGRCDPEGQIAFLAQNPSIAQAFASALNRDATLRWSGGSQVTVDQLPAYIRELTSVTLVADTRVTNYGYRNGRATPRQSVLQAGTAVMVDRYGVPRIKCNCGNPLTAPQAVSSTPTYTGPPWPGFSPTTIVVVQQTTVVIDVFVLVNIDGGGYIERTPGADGVDESPDSTTSTTLPGNVGTGDVRATLSWSGDCDLDLHVIDPSGTEIYYGNPGSPTGGQLDVDDIPDPGATGSHIENVFWPTGGAPRGAYTAFVRNLGGYTSSGCDFQLNVYVGEQLVGSQGGVLADGADSASVAWTY